MNDESADQTQGPACSYALVFVVLSVFLVLAHGPLISLPYFWDEIGQFVPAALDIFHHGAWVPISTTPNVHPPGVMAWLAAVWSVFGYSIEATRLAMLALASLGALFVFLLAIELSRGAPGTPAFSAIALFCLSPLFFAQSMMAQLDMPAMAASTLALLLFLQNRFRASAVACTVLLLIRETGGIVPVVFIIWLVAEKRWRDALWFLLPFPGFLAWLIYLHHLTGNWLGNPEFARYNVTAQLDVARISLSLIRRLYYLFIGSGHWIGTAALIYALSRMPLLRDRSWRLTATLVAANIAAFSVTGGAILERYLLSALPLVYIAFAVSFQALTPRTRKLALAALVLCLIAANVVNPPYPFPFENNLAFINFVDLEKNAAVDVEARPGRTIATRFPMTDALRNPEFGYVDQSRQVREIRDFSSTEIDHLRADPPGMVIVFNPTWDPFGVMGNPMVRKFLVSHFDYVPQLSAAEIAETLSMRIARTWVRGGQRMSLLVR